MLPACAFLVACDADGLREIARLCTQLLAHMPARNIFALVHESMPLLVPAEVDTQRRSYNWEYEYGVFRDGVCRAGDRALVRFAGGSDARERIAPRARIVQVVLEQEAARAKDRQVDVHLDDEQSHVPDSVPVSVPATMPETISVIPPIPASMPVTPPIPTSMPEIPPIPTSMPVTPVSNKERLKPSSRTPKTVRFESPQKPLGSSRDSARASSIRALSTQTSSASRKVYRIPKTSAYRR